MAWSKPFTADEIAAIEGMYPQLGAAEIAEKLGRSRRGVENVIKRIEKAAPHTRASCRPDEADGGALDKLRDTAGVLRAAMADAGPRDIAKLAHEYREYVLEIDRLERAEDGEERDGEGFDQLLGVISLRAT